MSLLSKMKSWFSSNQQTNNNIDPTEAFKKVCAARGLGDKYLHQTNAIELFNAWYDGDGSEEHIANSMSSFIADHDTISYSKFVRFFE